MGNRVLSLSLPEFISIILSLMNAREKYFVSYIVVHGHPNLHRFWYWLQVI